jgi:hypothetical protein
MLGFKQFLALSLVIYSGLPIASLKADNFSEIEKAQVVEIVNEFKSAMGKVSIDPAKHCPGLSSRLRTQLNQSESLIVQASQLETEEFNNSYFARSILDTEIAFKFVEKACGSKRV